MILAIFHVHLICRHLYLCLMKSGFKGSKDCVPLIVSLLTHCIYHCCCCVGCVSLDVPPFYVMECLLFCV